MTVNGLALLAIPATVTVTFPAVAPVGTGTAILVGFQLEAIAVVPLNEIVLLPWLEPKLVPDMVTDVPTGPNVGDKPVMLGPEMIVNDTPLLAMPPTVTTTLPVVAPVGTATTKLVEDQLLTVACVPLKATVLESCVAPKFVPEMRTVFPASPDTGDKFVMFGVASTVKATQLLFMPFT